MKKYFMIIICVFLLSCKAKHKTLQVDKVETQQELLTNISLQTIDQVTLSQDQFKGKIITADLNKPVVIKKQGDSLSFFNTSSIEFDLSQKDSTSNSVSDYIDNSKLQTQVKASQRNVDKKLLTTDFLTIVVIVIILIVGALIYLKTRTA
ncbi:hypothetical protein Phi19:2_gp017 [Cellulophaga phage phi19:2]|uniref:Lipoprotein n=3 Tax=Cellulophaga phage phiST TaxID=756282 RepID=M4SKB8_9CAUD|nr:hypothetical protein CGPG_00089 [Cellulophaga phage phiST]AGH56787.1 hypothetical protein CGPG_00089 [Cellulophaga phage phiST]AGO47156.1 hypothetical protein PhiST_gp017 [Cellulophaga phage phiST]AGO48652.1 hypothetical protein Phi19:2_gp017 [Cellulophaga phage phi19:2]AGO49022.1 hypothetical protein Phi13:1_gp011 [Cellulophaga phage phi13:1]